MEMFSEYMDYVAIPFCVVQGCWKTQLHKLSEEIVYFWIAYGFRMALKHPTKAS